MPIHEDDQFASYLKQFLPLEPGVFPPAKQRPARRRRILVAAWTAVAVLTLVVGWTLQQTAKNRAETGTRIPRDTDFLVNSQPLTIRKANALLAAFSSSKELVDLIAFRSEVKQISKEERSALAVLAKEKTKL